MMWSIIRSFWLTSSSRIKVCQSLTYPVGWFGALTRCGMFISLNAKAFSIVGGSYLQLKGKWVMKGETAMKKFTNAPHLSDWQNIGAAGLSKPNIHTVTTTNEERDTERVNNDHSARISPWPNGICVRSNNVYLLYTIPLLKNRTSNYQLV